MSSCVRPGVCEVRASALIRLDLPTLERPAKATSSSRIGGSDASEAAAVAKRQAPANSLRPASMSLAVNGGVSVMVERPTRPRHTTGGRLLNKSLSFLAIDLKL